MPHLQRGAQAAQHRRDAREEDQLRRPGIHRAAQLTALGHALLRPLRSHLLLPLSPPLFAHCLGL